MDENMFWFVIIFYSHLSSEFGVRIKIVVYSLVCTYF